MPRIPMTAKEQLQIAARGGHNLRVETRGPWPEHGDPHPKYRLHCTCGFSSRNVRSQKALNTSMIWHLSKVVADGLDEERRQGVSQTTRPQVG